MTQLIHHYATRQAAIRPDAYAIIAGKQQLTFAELEKQSNQLAHELVCAGAVQGDRVCLFMDKSPAAVVAMHGVMKADCIYVPIDISSPAPRVQRIIESCRPELILADRSGVKLLAAILPQLDESQVPAIGCMDPKGIEGPGIQCAFGLGDLQDASTVAPACKNKPDDPAHILFTSGSTGTPKGVVLSHRNVTHFVDWGREYFEIGPDDKVSGHPPLHFDLSTFDIYGSISAGAELHMVPAMANLLPNLLAKFIRESELTQWFSVPSALTLMARSEALCKNDFPALRRLLWCGEVLPTPTLIHWMKRLPHVQFTNLYGPTETTIASSYYTVPACPDDPRDQIPIGQACEEEQLYVLDADLRAVPRGEQGDLYISGEGLSLEYWEDSEKSASVFVDCDGEQGLPEKIYKTGDLAYQGEDGLFYFLGRIDSQIKSRGYRIELGEIETAMNALGLLKDCAVVGVPTGGFEGTAICCAFVPGSDSEVSPEIIRSNASKLLPSYMLPARWQNLSTLPKTGNGKTDRNKLRELFASEVTS